MEKDLYNCSNLKTLFGLIDLTTLQSTDTEEKIKNIYLRK